MAATEYTKESSRHAVSGATLISTSLPGSTLEVELEKLSVAATRSFETKTGIDSELSRLSHDAARSIKTILQSNPGRISADFVVDLINRVVEINDLRFTRFSDALGSILEYRPDLFRSKAVINVIESTEKNDQNSELLEAIASQAQALFPTLFPVRCLLKNVLNSILVKMFSDKELYAGIHPFLIGVQQQSPSKFVRELIDVSDLNSRFKSALLTSLVLAKPELYAEKEVQDELQRLNQPYRRSVANLFAYGTDKHVVPDEVQRIFAQPKVRVLCLATPRGGLGDEIALVSPLVAALKRHLGSRCEIHISTNRPYLYPTNAVNVSKRDQTTPSDGFDVVIDTVRHVLDRQHSFSEFGNFKGLIVSHHIDGKDEASIAYKLNGKEVLIPHTGSPLIYAPAQILCGELGLPPVWLTREESHNLHMPRVYQQNTAKYVRGLIADRQATQPLVAFNPWGYEGGRDDDFSYKGYCSPRRLCEDLETLVAAGNFVVLLPNQRVFGCESATKKVVALLPATVAKNIRVAREPETLPGLTACILSQADQVITCEGGMMHFAGAIGIPFRTLLFSPSMHLVGRWLPLGLSKKQEISSNIQGSSNSISCG